MKLGRPKGVGLQPLESRFWARVDKTETCWLWTGLTNKKGYGRIFVYGSARGCSGEMMLAHRVSWRLSYGEPGGLCVLHRCDVPCCVNPAHLFLGTRSENNSDMWKKGRGKTFDANLIPYASRLRGEQVAKVMTDETVRTLRVEYACGGTSFVKLGVKYGIGKTTVENIIKRRKWAHVE
jgi:HNH endonuclease